MTDMTQATSDFTVGERIQLIPALDAWIQGDRYGVVTKIGQTILTVKLDRSGRVRHFNPNSITHRSA